MKRRLLGINGKVLGFACLPVCLDKSCGLSLEIEKFKVGVDRKGLGSCLFSLKELVSFLIYRRFNFSLI